VLSRPITLHNICRRILALFIQARRRAIRNLPSERRAQFDLSNRQCGKAEFVRNFSALLFIQVMRHRSSRFILLREGRFVGLRAGLAVFALALLPAIAGDAVTNGPTKTDNNVRIVKKGTLGGEIKLYAVLTNCTEVTVTLKVTGDNVSLSRSVPFTVDSEGTNFLELVTLRATNPQRPWKYNSEFHWRPGRRGNVLTNSFAYHLPYAGETHRVV